VLSGCSGDGETDASSTEVADLTAGFDETLDAGLDEATKGEACELYRDLSGQIDDLNEEVEQQTVSTRADGEALTALMDQISELTEKADTAYATCYAEGSDT